MNTRFLIFGAGYSGRALAREALFKECFVAGTNRSTEAARHLEAMGASPVVYAAGQPPSPALTNALSQTTHLVVSIAPGEEGDQVLQLLHTLQEDALPQLRWIGYFSTVGVYGDHGGAWVNEESPCRPVSERTRRRVEAEKGWMAFAAARRLPAAILRLAGIYGAGRNAFLQLQEGRAHRIVKPGQVFNRVHVEDIAGATLHLARRREAGIFNISDDNPSPATEVVEHAARLMDVEPPPAVAFEDAELSPMARSFYSACKRTSNARLRATGYRLRHPEYRAALEAMWADGSWRAEPSPGKRPPVV